MKTQVAFENYEWQDLLIRRLAIIPNEFTFLKEEMKTAFKKDRFAYMFKGNPQFLLEIECDSFQPSKIETKIEDDVYILEDGIDFNDLYY
ncbi:MAG: hypothetical protein FWC41_10955 [Firmicutes bacterium]|nr:hypothetical protein [Bacillota bacterium]